MATRGDRAGERDIAENRCSRIDDHVVRQHDCIVIRLSVRCRDVAVQFGCSRCVGRHRLQRSRVANRRVEPCRSRRVDRQIVSADRTVIQRVLERDVARRSTRQDHVVRDDRLIAERLAPGRRHVAVETHQAGTIRHETRQRRRVANRQVEPRRPRRVHGERMRSSDVVVDRVHKRDVAVRAGTAAREQDGFRQQHRVVEELRRRCRHVSIEARRSTGIRGEALERRRGPDVRVEPRDGSRVDRERIRFGQLTIDRAAERDVAGSSARAGVDHDRIFDQRDGSQERDRVARRVDVGSQVRRSRPVLSEPTVEREVGVVNDRQLTRVGHLDESAVRRRHGVVELHGPRRTSTVQRRRQVDLAIHLDRALESNRLGVRHGQRFKVIPNVAAYRTDEQQVATGVDRQIGTGGVHAIIIELLEDDHVATGGQCEVARQLHVVAEEDVRSSRLVRANVDLVIGIHVDRTRCRDHYSIDHDVRRSRSRHERVAGERDVPTGLNLRDRSVDVDPHAVDLRQRANWQRGKCRREDVGTGDRHVVTGHEFRVLRGTRFVQPETADSIAIVVGRQDQVTRLAIHRDRRTNDDVAVGGVRQRRVRRLIDINDEIERAAIERDVPGPGGQRRIERRAVHRNETTRSARRCHRLIDRQQTVGIDKHIAADMSPVPGDDSTDRSKQHPIRRHRTDHQIIDIVERNVPRRRVHDRHRVHVVGLVQRDVARVRVPQSQHRRSDCVTRVLTNPAGRGLNPHGPAADAYVIVNQHRTARVQREVAIRRDEADRVRKQHSVRRDTLHRDAIDINELHRLTADRV